SWDRTWRVWANQPRRSNTGKRLWNFSRRSEEHTSELQSLRHLVCRLLLEKKKNGIQRLVGGGSAEGGAMHSVVLKWQEAHAKMGKHLELGERMCFGFHFYIADSREEGIREAAKYYEENMKMFGELRLVRALSDEQIEIMR